MDSFFLKFQVLHQSYEGPLTITGDIKELGGWEKSIRLFFVDSQIPKWESSLIEVKVKNTQIVQFKAVIEKANSKPEWENVPNRVINLALYEETKFLLISITFNSPEISIAPQNYKSSEAENIMFFLQNMKEYKNLITPKFSEKWVLTIRWEKTEEIDADKDCKEISAAFQERGFKPLELVLQNSFLTKEYGVNAQYYFHFDLFYNPIQKINEKINKNDLIIVFYSGHGILDASKILILSPGSNSKIKDGFLGIEFKRIRENFEEFNGPKLYILDCCYAGAAYRVPEKKNEFILAAAGQEQTTPCFSQFTQEICSEIKNKNSLEFNISHLYHTLLTKNLKKTPVLLNMGIGGNLCFKWSGDEYFKEKAITEIMIIEFIIHFDVNAELLNEIVNKVETLAGELNFEVKKKSSYKIMMGSSITTVVIFKIEESFARFLQGILPENVAFRITNNKQ